MHYIALLRAVNIGSHNKVGMAQLRSLFETLGMKRVRSLLLSGNVVFEGPAVPAASLERRLEREVEETLGVATDILLRSAGEWNDIIEANPFVKEAKEDPAHLLVMCLREPPKGAAVAALEEAIRGRERFRAGTRHAYLVYPDGIARSRLTIGLIESKLGTRGTARNWNTVLKLKGMLA